METKKGNKIVIIGAGFVGSTTAFALMQSNLVSELILIDIDENKAEGDALDLNHGIPFGNPMEIRAGDYSDCKNADIIIMAAGPSIKPGQTRLDLAYQNSKIMKDIMLRISKYTSDAIIIVASNPVDILTYVGVKSVDYDKQKVIGSGTVLDTSRFRYLLSKKCEIDARNIHGYIIGEHGDSEVLVWSLTNIVGVSYDEFCKNCKSNCAENDKVKIFEEVRDFGYEIFKKKGATYYGIALSLKRIVEAVLLDENSVLTVSSLLEGEYGLKDVALSVPTIINSKGVEKVLELSLENKEKDLLFESAKKLKDYRASDTLMV